MVTKYCGKEEKLLLMSSFFSFAQYLQYMSNFRSQITYSFVKCDRLIYIFCNSANLICRSSEISKCFRESLGLRENESQMYFSATPPHGPLNRAVPLEHNGPWIYSKAKI